MLFMYLYIVCEFTPCWPLIFNFFLYFYLQESDDHLLLNHSKESGLFPCDCSWIFYRLSPVAERVCRHSNFLVKRIEWRRCLWFLTSLNYVQSERLSVLQCGGVYSCLHLSQQRDFSHQSFTFSPGLHPFKARSYCEAMMRSGMFCSIVSKQVYWDWMSHHPSAGFKPSQVCCCCKTTFFSCLYFLCRSFRPMDTSSFHRLLWYLLPYLFTASVTLSFVKAFEWKESLLTYPFGRNLSCRIGNRTQVVLVLSVVLHNWPMMSLYVFFCFVMMFRTHNSTVFNFIDIWYY